MVRNLLAGSKIWFPNADEEGKVYSKLTQEEESEMENFIRNTSTDHTFHAVAGSTARTVTRFPSRYGAKTGV